MAVGLTTTLAEVNAQAGYLAQTLSITMTNVQSFKAWMDTQTDAQLIALGFVQADVNTLRSAFTDLDQLRAVYQGSATRTPAYDYRTFAKLLSRWGF